MVIRTYRFGMLLPAGLAVLLSMSAWAEDWPTRLHDIRRGGVISEHFEPSLDLVWSNVASRAPSPAWQESPARHDGFHNLYDLKQKQNFDFCYDVAVVGGFLYYGSSHSGAIVCLNADDGSRAWRFFTDGPVRFAPHVADGKVYAGSDDGYVYCLNASDGSLVWRERAGPSDRKIWGNGRMISMWPVRTSVLVDGSDVFWAAGFFPKEGMYLCRRNAVDGSGGWTVTPTRPPQGYLLATSDYVYVPSGKTQVNRYSRASGGSSSDFSGGAGTWALLTPDNSSIWTGPAKDNRTRKFGALTRTYAGDVANANYLVADSTYAYYNTDSKIAKIRREDHSAVWTQSLAYPHALIMADDILFAGGDGEVAALDDDGECLWTGAVSGKAYGLAAANGRLYVSTDTGGIYAFGQLAPSVSDGSGATNVTGSSAQFTGYLASTGAAPTEVYVFWGTSNGGDVIDAWGHTNQLDADSAGPLTSSVSNLEVNTTYYYRFYATNAYGGVWGGLENFTTHGVIPFSDNFEERLEGDLDGQYGWTATGAVVQTNTVVEGVQAVGIEGWQSEVSHLFEEGRPSVWTDLRLQPVFGTPASDPPDGSTFAFYLNTNGLVMAFDGSTPSQLVGVVLQPNEWARFTVHSDHVNANWDLWVNGVSVGIDLEFYSPRPGSYSGLILNGCADGTTYIDNVNIGLRKPLDMTAAALFYGR